jgi:class 3 adenylate cyclase
MPAGCGPRTIPGESDADERLQPFGVRVRQECGRFRGRIFTSHPGERLITFDGPARAIRYACLLAHASERPRMRVRFGLHTGEFDLDAGRLAGLALDICRQVTAIAAAGEVLVSRTVKDLVAGSGLQFEDRGSYHLAALPAEWRLFAAAATSS